MCTVPFCCLSNRCGGMQSLHGGIYAALEFKTNFHMATIKYVVSYRIIWYPIVLYLLKDTEQRGCGTELYRILSHQIVSYAIVSYSGSGAEVCW